MNVHVAFLLGVFFWKKNRKFGIMTCGEDTWESGLNSDSSADLIRFQLLQVSLESFKAILVGLVHSDLRKDLLQPSDEGNHTVILQRKTGTG